MKTLSQFVLGIFLIGLISCENDELATTAKGDAYIMSHIAEQDTVFGLVLRAASNKNFKSVSVAPEDIIDVSYQLSSNQGFQNDFLYQTEEENYGTEIPQTGIYTFTATIENDEVISFSDDLKDDILPPPTIVSCTFDDTDDQIELEWETDDNVDVYSVKVYTDQDKLVFISPGINPDDKIYKVKSTSYGWLSNYTPLEGATYTVELNAFLYEPIKSEMNLQCQSLNTITVDWGN